ncbi:hypothetical protein GCM10010967_13570 [Dyadobacter beijingensis]|uniref:Carboxypeptidase regulatory-like domain-containing protein n=2 Tax=Dyadobacter beijingensis TaxID=365489 RepID=A0ABQ2HJ58_9BACT|nr:hypothetical protein GCM10010967_13570 [Dyadobacter beijingensis]
MLLTICSCKDNQTTVVFGKVVDQKQQPVDSIMVIATGSRAIPERLNHTFTDSLGGYTLTIDVPKKYHTLNIFIPYLSENPKFEAHYKIENIYKNAQKVGSCCFTEIGEKTR